MKAFVLIKTDNEERIHYVIRYYKFEADAKIGLANHTLNMSNTAKMNHSRGDFKFVIKEVEI